MMPECVPVVSGESTRTRCLPRRRTMRACRPRRLDPELLAAIDKARGTTNRTAWLEEAARARLKRYLIDVPPAKRT